MLLATNICFADSGELSRTAKFASPDQFAAAAWSFHPATKPSELSYIFSAPELSNDNSTYGNFVFAEGITEVTELSRTPDVCAYFVKAEPKTDYTCSYAAGLFLLRLHDNSAWRIATIEQFHAIGVCGWIECRAIHYPTTAKKSPPLTFRVTETDADRHLILDKRVYTL